MFQKFSMVFVIIGNRKNDATILRVHFNYLHRQYFIFTEMVQRLLNLRNSTMACWDKALKVFVNLDNYAVIKHANYFTIDFSSIWIVLSNLWPRVFLHLFDSQTYATFFSIGVQNLNLNTVAFTDNFFWMTNTFGPRHIRDMNQSVNALFNFNKSAKVGQVTNASFNNGTNWVTL